MPHIFPLTNPHHLLLSYTILLACLAYKPLFFLNSPSQYQPTSSTADVSSHSPTYTLLAILQSLHMANHLINPLSTPFMTLHNSLIYVFGTLPTLLIPSKPLTLSICTALILDIFFYIIASLQYVRTGLSNVSGKLLAYLSCRSLALAKDLIVTVALLSLTTFSYDTQPHLYLIHPKPIQVFEFRHILQLHPLHTNLTFQSLLSIQHHYLALTCIDFQTFSPTNLTKTMHHCP